MNCLSLVVIHPSPTVCQFLENELQKKGHQVHSFLEPVAALHVLLQTRILPMPDMLFLSLKSTSQLTGYEALKRFRTHDPQLSLVIMCSPDDALIRLKARQEGASTFLDEPVKIQQIVALVQRFTTRPTPSTN
jgi:DNA-binding NtrC family response regulator